MKQITIYDLIPLLKKGWVACDENGWAWFSNKPKYKFDRFGFESEYKWMMTIGDACNLSAKCCPFNIDEFKGDWKNSLISVKKEQKNIKIKKAIFESSKIVLNELKKENQKYALDALNEYKKILKGGLND